jgi:putative transposase
LVSSAIKWVRRHRETGSISPGKMGGHKPNILAGAHADWMIARTQTDVTLRGLVTEAELRISMVSMRSKPAPSCGSA